MTLDPIAFWIVIAIAFFAGGALFWDLAVHDHRRARQTFEKRLNELGSDAATFRAEERADPQRAWLDAGKRSVLRQFEGTARTVRDDLETER